MNKTFDKGLRGHESLQQRRAAPIADGSGGSTEDGVEEEEEEGVLSCGAHGWLLLRPQAIASRESGTASR